LFDNLLTVKLDEATGAISSLQIKGIKSDLVNIQSGMGLNDYFYVAGRRPDSPQRNGQVRISVKEKGPLVASLLIESEAPGCNKLTREIRLVYGLNRVDIINTIDKKNIYLPESVHVAFPFYVPDGVMRMDVAWGLFRPEHGQLPGSNKNHFAVQRWVDVSNQEYGLTWATVDAPLVEVGNITADPTSVGWIQHLKPSQTLYSYIMNNYWETNYKASQEGPAVFRYSLKPHGPFNPTEAKRFGIERLQPLIVVPADRKQSTPSSLFKINPSAVMATSIKPSRD
ncbi:unnamed protein product, partial [marine sediment metagenome]